MSGATYKICSCCVMDTSDPDIVFDDQGKCNHCYRYEDLVRNSPNADGRGPDRLEKIVTAIRNAGADKKYDCVVGLSGGVDSSYMVYQAVKMGLRPLAIHLDNAWDSELAVNNIENIVKKLNIDLITYVIDWDEFRDLQRSFFKASVVDIEMLSDHAITASVYRIAAKKNIKYILAGGNIATEAVMPKKWVHRKSDLKNIKSIQKKFGTRKISNFPTCSTLNIHLYHKRILGKRVVNILNYLPYNKEEAIRSLENDLCWRYYGGKHYESIFTKFYQAYILPTKFGIDKRRAHLSSLICSGQISRSEALEQLQEDLYDSVSLNEDRTFVLKKLGMSEDEFREYLAAPPMSHYAYGSDQFLVSAVSRFNWLSRLLIR